MNDSYVLGIDFGEARIGLALAHSQAKLPRPYKILDNTPQVFDQISQIVDGEHVSQIVLGLPRNQSGQETAQTEAVRKFANNLKSEVKADIVFADESLSTQRAEEMRKDLKNRPKTEPVDDLAACFILEEFYRGNIYGKV